MVDKRVKKNFGTKSHWRRLSILAKPVKIVSKPTIILDIFLVKKSALNYTASPRIIELAKHVEKKEPEVIVEKPPKIPPYRRFFIPIEISESFFMTIPVKILTTFNDLPPRIDEISKPCRTSVSY
ncbi:hypothetical protein DMENIID0001_145140 [Sergentomyia squamirostris]